MTKNLAELKETFAKGQLERKDILDLRDLIYEELEKNQQQKPFNEYLNRYSWYEQRKANKDVFMQYLHQKPTQELQEVAEFTLQVAKEFKKLYKGDAYSENTLLTPLASEPQFTKSILRFAKENHIGTTADGYPAQLVSRIAETDNGIQVKPFERALVYKNLLGFLIDEAREHKLNPEKNNESSMLDVLTVISNDMHDAIRDTTLEKILNRRTYDAFREIMTNGRQDENTLDSAHRFLMTFLRDCRDEELKYNILQNVISAASRPQKSSLMQSGIEKTR